MTAQQPLRTETVRIGTASMKPTMTNGRYFTGICGRMPPWSSAGGAFHFHHSAQWWPQWSSNSFSSSPNALSQQQHFFGAAYADPSRLWQDRHERAQPRSSWMTLQDAGQEVRGG